MNYKIAANPLPIPEGEIILIVQDFMTKIKKNLISKIGTKLFSAWVLHYDELPSSFYDNYFRSEYILKHKDITGSPTVSVIMLAINPYQEQPGIFMRAMTDEERAVAKVEDEERGNIIIVALHSTYVKYWQQWVREGMLSENQLEATIGDTIYQKLSHEMTHAVDQGLPYENKKFTDAYYRIFERTPESTPEELLDSHAFYFTTREEIKSHVNEIIAELNMGIRYLGIDNFLEKDFLSFVNGSRTLSVVKKNLAISPKDHETKVLGKSIARRKEEALKKILNILHSWWEKKQKNLREEFLFDDINPDTLDRKTARQNRVALLSKLLKN